MRFGEFLHSWKLPLSSFIIWIWQTGKVHKKVRFPEASREIGHFTFEPLKLESKIIDGVTFINIDTPKTTCTFVEYNSANLWRKFIDFCKLLPNLILCLKLTSMIGRTRENKKKGIQTSRKQNQIFRWFQDFMNHDMTRLTYLRCLLKATI